MTLFQTHSFLHLWVWIVGWKGFCAIICMGHITQQLPNQPLSLSLFCPNSNWNSITCDICQRQCSLISSSGSLKCKVLTIFLQGDGRQYTLASSGKKVTPSPTRVFLLGEILQFYNTCKKKKTVSPWCFLCEFTLEVRCSLCERAEVWAMTVLFWLHLFTYN